MVVGNREQNIRRIIEMEDRICQCQRCPSLVKCLRKPSMGKGELDPEALLVFEYENNFTRDINNIIRLRNIIKQELKLDKVYHTYMVRCQPKACATRQSVNCYGQGKWIDKDYTCLLSNKACDGIPVRPGTDEIISCLPFLLEEIEILHPPYLLLFGERVTEFVLKSYGVYSNLATNQRYEYGEMIFLTSVDENEFRQDNCHQLLNALLD
jgi:uracil-DNA glycosylase